MIRELRILPPIAIGRFGSAPTPVDNYTLGDDPDDPLGYRRIVPAPTLIVDDKTGEICDCVTPAEIRFREDKEDKKIRPVAPFLEIFAIDEDGALAPLTADALGGDEGAEIEWRVHVANRKVYRRTGDEDDIVRADTGWFSDHAPHPLEGRCANFISDTATVGFGSVRFIRPNAGFPEIRLRFTPPPGLIYGPDAVPEEDRERYGLDARNRGDGTEAVIPPERSIYDHTKSWFHFGDDHPDAPGRPGYREEALGYRNETVPPSLFAIVPPAPSWLHNNRAVSRGYLDDACDGFVEVRLRRPDAPELTAKARICVGPPDVAPDSLFLRTLKDDLEQAVHGPRIDDEPPGEVRSRALDIVRRAFETVRFMNLAVMNGNDIKGRSALTLDSMPQEESADTERAIHPVMPPETVDTAVIAALHQQVYAALQAGSAPWFVPLLRRPTEVSDFTDHGRRKMPAMMCGADNGYLALTERQIETITRAARLGPTMDPPGEPQEPALTARNLTAQINHAAAGNPISSRPVTSVANCCPGLEMDFRAAWRRIFEGIELREYDNLVTDCALDPEALKMLDPGARSLTGHRLLRVVLPRTNQGLSFTAEIRGPAPSDPANAILLTTDENPNGLAPLEWSNALTRMLAEPEATEVDSYFTREPAHFHEPYDREAGNFVKVRLKVRRFFEDDTAVIAEALAEAGELTQGLCSPWQNDYRECSCYYWASARPDFVNVELGLDGMSGGDNWLQKKRTGAYVPDDYVDSRLMLYEDLFRDWERLLRFQIGGRDAPEEKDAT